MKPRLTVFGAAGRMGRRILSLAVQGGNFEIAAAVDREGHPDTGKDAGILAGTDNIGVNLTSSYEGTCDAAIDFSLPEAAPKTLEYCKKAGAALVMGTTGLGKEQVKEVKTAAEQIPVIYGTNMSIGMNVLFGLVGRVARMLGDEYDIEIIEKHHRMKKDAPSGSALTLAENICAETGKDLDGSFIYGRSGKDVLRQKGTIGIHAVRAGDITGDHSVMFTTLGETVTLHHNAHSRDNFARGALAAAEWLSGRKPGIYTMADCLELE